MGTNKGLWLSIGGLLIILACVQGTASQHMQHNSASQHMQNSQNSDSLESWDSVDQEYEEVDVENFDYDEMQQAVDEEEEEASSKESGGPSRVNFISATPTPVFVAQNPSHNSRICSTFGYYHFKTFDGDIYTFPGHCNYVLASHCKSSYEEFNIQIRRVLRKNIPVIDVIKMKIEGADVEITNEHVKFNDEKQDLPYSFGGIQVSKTGTYIRMHAKIGIELLWNEEDSILMEVSPKFANQTCGLCGDFNGIPIYNEFIINDVRMSDINYGNLQKYNGPEERCEDVTEEPENNCTLNRGLCRTVLTGAAFQQCNRLVDVSRYIEICEKDLCRCTGNTTGFCLCNIFTEYSRQCTHAGGKPKNWRTSKLCPLRCSFNLEFRECGSACQDTCTNPERSLVCDDHCTDGCFCPAGMIFDDINRSGCIPKEQCPCTFNGEVYASGTGYSEKCQACTCYGGKWSCIRKPCFGICSLEGGSHITTFDLSRYNFHGDCSYTLTKSCEGLLFSILAEIRKCGLTDTETCLKSISLSLNGGKDFILIKTCGSVYINSVYTQLPVSTASLTIFKPSSFYIIAQTKVGIQLKIQLEPTMQVYVIMDPEHMNQTCGLCGNFNNIQSDDFKSPSGVIEGTGPSFGNLWKIQADCPNVRSSFENPCSLSSDAEQFATHWCSLITDSEGPFAACHKTVDPTPYHENCMFDSCNCEKSEKCMCTALSSYVYACNRQGVDLRGWRKHACGVYTTTCPATLTYSYTVSTCQPTCRSISEPDETCKVSFMTVDGCICEDGTYLDESGKCVLPALCPCFHQGSPMSPGEVVHENGAICTCTNGKLECIGKQSEEKEVCEDPLVYFDCKNAPPESKGSECQKSCSTFDTECYSTECVSGCMCPEGLVINDDGDCVSEEECPCVHNNDFFDPGEVIQVECNTCTCKKRKWDCTTNTCLATCAVYGDGHYITFDTKRYHFNGDCQYTLAQDYCSDDAKDGTFRVITENIPCGTTGTTCSKSIKLFLGNYQLILGDQKFDVVKREFGQYVPFRVRQMGIYMVVEALNGLVLVWDKKTAIFIKLHPNFQGKVCGLCGNYDGSTVNDFITRSLSVVGDVNEFGNSWKLSPSCPDAVVVRDPCSHNPYRKSWAQRQCSILTGPVFYSCHALVDPSKYYDACVNDACACDTGGDCECFCTAVASYAQACSEAGECVSWRTPTMCPVFCDYYNREGHCEWHYQACGAPCLKTCRNPTGVCFNNLTGLEGCYPKCPPNRPYFDEETMRCVSSCYCYDEYDKDYKPGQKMPSENRCSVCHCTNTGKVCSKQPVCCYYENKEFLPGDIIYSTSDGIGGCINAICSDNSTIERSIGPCATTVSPSTEFDFSTSSTSTGSSTGPTESTVPGSSTSNPSGSTPSTTIHTSTGPSIYTSPGSSSSPTSSSPIESSTGPSSPSSSAGYPSPSTTSKPKTTSTGPADTTSTGSSTGETSSPTSSEPGSTSPSSTTISTAIPTICVEAYDCSWSQWYDVSNPDLGDEEGDFETFDNIRAKGYKLCEKPKSVQCRAKEYPDQPLEDIGQDVTCSRKNGLICLNRKNSPICHNFEMRIECCNYRECTAPSSQTSHEVEPTSSQTTSSKEVNTSPSAESPSQVTSSVSPTTACIYKMECRWTQWYDTNEPSIKSDGGEVESIPDIKKNGTEICTNKEVENKIECEALDNEGLPVTNNKQVVSCDLENGLACWNRDQQKKEKCKNHRIRVECCAKYCESPQTPIISTTSSTELNTSPGSSAVPSEPGATTSPIPTSTLSTRAPGTPTHMYSTPAVVTGSTSPSVVPSVIGTSQPSSACTYKKECRWTKWYDLNQPNTKSDGGDSESIEDVKAKGHVVCINGEIENKLQCEAIDKYGGTIAGNQQVMSCVLKGGLRCRNSDQKEKEKCHNYKIRVECCLEYCEQKEQPVTGSQTTESSSTETPETSVPSSTATGRPSTGAVTEPGYTTTENCEKLRESECRWTEWFNEDKPTSDRESGDSENSNKLMSKGIQVCTQDEIENEIECRAEQHPDLAFEDHKQISKCNVKEGLVCKNEDQEDGKTCHDYKIRIECCSKKFVKSCGETTSSALPITTEETRIPMTTAITESSSSGSEGPPTTTSTGGTSTSKIPGTKSTSTPSPTSYETTKAACILKMECRWTQWYDNSRPNTKSDGGDSESLEDIQSKGTKVCSKGEIPSKIECGAFDKKDNIVSNNQQVTTCDLESGLTCRNRDQEEKKKCHNYKVRFECCEEYCEKTETASTSSPITTGATTTLGETLSPGTSASSSTTAGLPSTGAVTEPGYTTTKNCEKFRASECRWTEWFNKEQPSSDIESGENENSHKLKLKGIEVCKQDEVENQIECRAEQYSDLAYNDRKQVFKCNVKEGLVCRNKDQAEGENCHDYEIRIECCSERFLKSCGELSTSTASPSTSEETKVPLTTAVTGYTSHEPETETPSGSPSSAGPKTTTSKSSSTSSVTEPSSPGSKTTETSTSGRPTTTSVTEPGSPGAETSSTSSSSTGPTSPGNVYTTSTCVYKMECRWTQWYDNNEPNKKSDGGDNESIEDIKSRGAEVCSKEEVENKIECEALNKDGTPIYDNKQVMTCDVKTGLTCRNREQEKKIKCHNYRIRYECCAKYCERLETPATSSSITTKSTTTVGGYGTSKPSATSISYPTVTEQPSTGVVTEPGYITTENCEKFRASECRWTEWFNKEQPSSDIESGENENSHKLKLKGIEVCKQDEVENQIECRAEQYSDLAYNDRKQVFKCNVKEGLVCRNKDQAEGENCHDYEIRIECCSERFLKSCGELSTSTASSSTSEETKVPLTTAVTGYTSHEPETETPGGSPSSAGPKTTTSESSSTSSVTEPSSPGSKTTETSTSGRPTTTSVTEPGSPGAETSSTSSSSTGPTSPGNVYTTSTCVYKMECRWTQWYDNNEPNKKSDGGDNESIEDIKSRGAEVCSKEEVENKIECEALNKDGTPIYDNKQVMTCDVKTGLTCRNREQEKKIKCHNYRIRYECCAKYCERLETPATSSSITTKSTTTVGGYGTSKPSATSISYPTVTEQPSTGVVTEPGYITTENCEKFRASECRWTEWFNKEQPSSDIESGENENSHKLKLKGIEVCKQDEVENQIECRAEQYSDLAYNDRKQVFKCNVKEGLVCRNKDQAEGENCHDYEIRIECCSERFLKSCGELSTSTASSSTSEETKVPLTTAVTGYTSHEPETETPGGSPSSAGPKTTTSESSSTSSVTEPSSPGSKTTETSTSGRPTTTSVTEPGSPGAETSSTSSSSTGPTSPGNVYTTSTCVYKMECRWTQWYDNNEPNKKSDGGDNESIEDIKSRGAEVCSKEEVENKIECEALNKDGTPIYDNKQVMTCDVKTGLTCRNREQEKKIKCHNYRIRYECCAKYCERLETPATSSSITTKSTTTVGGYGTSKPSATSISYPTVTERPSTGVVTEPGYITTESCEKFRASECRWTEWFNKEQPSSDIESGENENSHKLKLKGIEVCKQDEVENQIECRAEQYSDLAYNDRKQVFKCNVKEGLVCRNKDQAEGENCHDYEIRIECCSEHFVKSCGKFTTSPASPSSTEETKIPSTTAITKPSSHDTSPFTSAPGASTSSTPGTSSETSTSGRPTSSSPSTTITCEKFRQSECHWTEWFNEGKPSSDIESGDTENSDKLRSKGIEVCKQEEVENQIECRTAQFPDLAYTDIKQVSKCNIKDGLVCNNKDQSENDTKCHDYEIRIECCSERFVKVCGELVTSPASTLPSEMTKHPSTTSVSEPSSSEPSPTSSTSILSPSTESPSSSTASPSSSSPSPSRTTTSISSTSSNTVIVSSTSGTTSYPTTSPPDSSSAASSTSATVILSTRSTPPSSEKSTSSTTSPGGSSTVNSKTPCFCKVNETFFSPGEILYRQADKDGCEYSAVCSETCRPVWAMGQCSTPGTTPLGEYSPSSTSTPTTETSEVKDVTSSTSAPTGSAPTTDLVMSVTGGDSYLTRPSRRPPSPGSTEKIPTESSPVEYSPTETSPGGSSPSVTSPGGYSQTESSAGSTSPGGAYSPSSTSTPTAETSEVKDVTSSSSQMTRPSKRPPASTGSTVEGSGSTTSAPTGSAPTTDDSLVMSVTGGDSYLTRPSRRPPSPGSTEKIPTESSPGGYSPTETSPGGSSPSVTSPGGYSQTESSAGSTSPGGAYSPSSTSTPTAETSEVKDVTSSSSQMTRPSKRPPASTGSTVEGSGSTTSAPTGSAPTTDNSLVMSVTGGESYLTRPSRRPPSPGSTEKIPTETSPGGYSPTETSPGGSSPSVTSTGGYSPTESSPGSSSPPETSPACGPCECLMPTCGTGYRVVSYRPPGACCANIRCEPDSVCVVDNTIYQRGSTVPQPKDVCQQCECSEQEKEEESGLYAVKCQPIVCEETCKEGFTYIKKEEQCCGECVPNQCTMKGVDDKQVEIKIGESYRPEGSTCSYYECDEEDGKPIVTKVKKICQELDVSKCEQDTIKYDEDGCCQTCTLKKEVIVEEKPVGTGDCSSRKNLTVLKEGDCEIEVELTYCGGPCMGSSTYSMEAQDMDHKCTCCTELEVEERQVELLCANGQRRSYTYKNVVRCGCAGAICTPVSESAELAQQSFQTAS